MPPYLLHLGMWKAIWPVPLTALLIALILMGCTSLVEKRQGWFVAFYAFSMLGLVTGTLAGFSRESILGAVLPAVLSLVGGLAIYLIGKENGNRILVSMCVLALSFCLFLGSTWGAILRQTAEDARKSVLRSRNSGERWA